MDRQSVQGMLARHGISTSCLTQAQLCRFERYATLSKESINGSCDTELLQIIVQAEGLASSTKERLDKKFADSSEALTRVISDMSKTTQTKESVFDSLLSSFAKTDTENDKHAKTLEFADKMLALAEKRRPLAKLSEDISEVMMSLGQNEEILRILSEAKLVETALSEFCGESEWHVRAKNAILKIEELQGSIDKWKKLLDILLRVDAEVSKFCTDAAKSLEASNKGAASYTSLNADFERFARVMWEEGSKITHID